MMKNVFRQIGALARLSILDLYRRKDLIVVLLLTAVLLVPLAFLTPFGVKGASRQTNEIALLLIWIFSLFLSMGIANRLLPPEFENRTIFPLLSKPVSRSAVVVGKYVGAVLASLSALTLFYLFFAIFCGLREGTWFPVILIQAYLLHIGFILVVTSMSMLFSLILTPSANWTLGAIVSLSMLFFGGSLPHYAAGQTQPLRGILTFVHWFAPHLDFFDMRLRVIHHWAPIPWSLCGIVLLYAVIYSAIGLWLAGIVFRHKKI